MIRPTISRSFISSILFTAVCGATVICAPEVCAQEAKLLDIILAEPIVVNLTEVTPQQPVGVAPQPPSSFVVMTQGTTSAQQAINQLPPAPASKFNQRSASRLPSRGGSPDIRFASPTAGNPVFMPQLSLQPSLQPSPSVTQLLPTPGRRNRLWSESETFGGVKPWVALTGRRVGNAFGLGTIHGVAERGSASEHPSGLALDFMVNKDSRRGDAIADYLMRNAAAERVLYIIWRQRIWHTGAAYGAWQPMKDRGGITANHFDHVHASFVG